jgi:EAL domain-containing protein (putative c-di-GMP-specific phosphodiesterase class I)
MNLATGSNKRGFKAGEIIIRQGERGECAYLIESGKVEISIKCKAGDVIIVGTRGPGAIVGEMAIVDDSPRVATVKALEDCSMLEISREDFARRIEGSDPVLQMITQVILTRYRDMLARTELFGESMGYPPPEELEKELALKTDAVEYIKIANEFREALENNQLQLHYQPILNLENFEIIGFEALMRWEHPTRGFVSPGIFIPIAEDTGLILSASGWALKEACSALKRIEGSTGYTEDIYMSVNFSSTDFASENFVESVYNTLSVTDVPARQVCLEITERILMNQPESASDTLDMCRKAGMSIAIDDFGTGYSSLSYLHSFPIQHLKIDRSFVSDMDKKQSSLELVKSIVALGKNMKLKTIAEGVERKEESDLLREIGCDYAQGFYYAYPQSEKEIIQLVRNWDKSQF